MTDWQCKLCVENSTLKEIPDQWQTTWPNGSPTRCFAPHCLKQVLNLSEPVLKSALY